MRKSIHKVPDLLHLLLRIVSHLYWHTAQKHCKDADAIKALHAWMKTELQVRCNSSKRANKNQDAVKIMNRKESFIGRECLHLLDVHEKLIDYIFDTMLEGKQPPEVKARALAAWTDFDNLWEHLNTRIGEEGSNRLPPQADRDAAAAETQRLGDLFVRSFALAGGSSSSVSSIYLHVIKFHLADAVKEYGNLMDYSCQGSEHAHQWVKRACRLSNGHKDTLQLQAMIGSHLIRKNNLEAPSMEGTKAKRTKPNAEPASTLVDLFSQ